MSVERFVPVLRIGECELGDDLFVVDDVRPERLWMRRLYSNVAADVAQQDLLAAALHLLEQGRDGAPRLVDSGVDREKRVCLVFEAPRLLPSALVRPRTVGETAALALRAVDVVDQSAGLPHYRAGWIRADRVLVDVRGRLWLRDLVWTALTTLRPPPSWTWVEDDHGAGRRMADDVADLVRAWWPSGPPRNSAWTSLLAWLRNHAGPRVPARFFVGIADARRALDVLADADLDEDARVDAAVTLAASRGVEAEARTLLVRALNEPLPRLPRLARELLADWHEPTALLVDARTGLLRACPHRWGATEIVDELGGVGVVRYCASCEARVTLPHTLEAFAERSDVVAGLVRG